MDIIQSDIVKFFEEKLEDLQCQYETRSYIISIYGKYRFSDFDLSQDSITLLFSQARFKQDFLIYQNIGDWLFFIKSMAPQHLNNASEEYYDTIARLSYSACYKLINRQWRLFEELSDNYQFLQEQIKNKLPKLSEY